MNFFVYDSTNKGIEGSPDIWIYFAVSAGLTAITLTLYYCIAGRFRRKSNDSDIEGIPRMNLRRGYTGLTEKSVNSSV
jgi:hypothetical protein